MNVVDAQLQSPLWPVCPDMEITFVCQQPTREGTGTLTWRLRINGMTNLLTSTYQTASQLGISRPFDGDSFGFMASLVANSPTFNSTLTVTTNRRLHGTVVECDGLLLQDFFSQTINITSKSSLYYFGS